jgi:hypothetical protein
MMNKYTQTTQTPQAPPTPPAYSDRQFLHTYLAGALLPLVQATITAVMVMIGAVALLYYFNAIDLIKPVFVVGVLTWVGTWLYLQRRWLNLTALERVLNWDINGDGRIGREPKPETVIRVDKITENRSFQQRRYTFSITDEQLLEFARGMVEGKPISRRRWAGPDKTFSDGEYRTFQTELIKWQLIESGGNGFILTEEGEDFFEGYVEQHAPPSPAPPSETP